MQSIVRIAAVVLTATPLAALAAAATPQPDQLALAAEADGGAYAVSDAVKRARYASLIKQAEGLCRIYQGQARMICVGEARMKFSP